MCSQFGTEALLILEGVDWVRITKMLSGEVWNAFIFTVGGSENPPVFTGLVPGSGNGKH